MRNCTKCGENKTFDQFYAQKNGAFGLKSECKPCTNLRNKKWILNNPNSVLAISKRHRSKFPGNRRSRYLKNKERDLKASKEWYSANKHRKALTQSLWDLRNPDKLRMKERKYASLHAAAITAKNNRRRFSHALFDRLDEQYKTQIVDIYTLAKEIGWLVQSKMAVDHIVPLRNKNVCGLHAPWNLQILPMYLNAQKHNRFDGTYENEGWKT